MKQSLYLLVHEQEHFMELQKRVTIWLARCITDHTLMEGEQMTSSSTSFESGHFKIHEYSLVSGSVGQGHNGRGYFAIHEGIDKVLYKWH